jgi:hypothetical protein
MAQKKQGHVCIHCAKPESANTPGATFTSNGDNGMVIVFWMCNQCSVPLGPGQGPIDMDDPTLKV